MKSNRIVCLLAAFVGCLTACREEEAAVDEGTGAVENIDPAEREAAAKLKVVKDPVQQEKQAFNGATRKLFEERRFEELEKLAAELRAGKTLFRDGSWKIREFYKSFECADEEPAKAWKAVERIHEEWIAAKPASITAQVAQANFLVNYAWFARGSGYASTVSERENFSFEKRLEAALQVLKNSRSFPEKDPIWWQIGLKVALGQGWPAKAFDELLDEAVAFEPQFYGYDFQRAYSLLPRWYGEPGDWETYAMEAAERKGGLGAEIYARIVIGLLPFHGQIFRESKASWPKTKEGLQQLRKKYPDSLELVNHAALLATMACDQAYAKEMFELLGDTYLPSVFPKRTSFAHYRNWARTGSW